MKNSSEMLKERYKKVEITNQGDRDIRNEFNKFLQEENILMFCYGLVGHPPSRWDANLKKHP